jgi:hypothetical protein
MAVTSEHNLTDISGSINAVIHVDNETNWEGHAKVFDYGFVAEGIYSKNRLINGKKWLLNKFGTHDYYEVT